MLLLKLINPIKSEQGAVCVSKDSECVYARSCRVLQCENDCIINCRLSLSCHMWALAVSYFSLFTHSCVHVFIIFCHNVINLFGGLQGWCTYWGRAGCAEPSLISSSPLLGWKQTNVCGLLAADPPLVLIYCLLPSSILNCSPPIAPVRTPFPVREPPPHWFSALTHIPYLITKYFSNTDGVSLK